MPLLPRRFERLKSVLNHRMADLTVLLEHVEKPHNLSAILRLSLIHISEPTRPY